MLRMPRHTSAQTPKISYRVIAIAAVGLAVSGFVITPLVHADVYQDQINALNQQNATKQDSVNQLGAQAASLTDTINKLQAEISNLQAQITANAAKQVEVQGQIDKATADLATQRDYLSQNLKAMYVDGQMSTTEMLATSKSLSDFVDQEQYHNAVQSKVQQTLDNIKKLQAQLADQKATLERVIANQQQMKDQVASQQAEQNRLLSLNQAQQADLNGQIAANNSKVTDLRKQQAAENARLLFGNRSGGAIPAGSRGGGGYPSVWADAAQDSILDSWGMYNRECVSYTAYRVAASGRFMPYWGGVGNANQWDDNARAAGIPVDTNPRAGDVAISNAGAYGHAMYVEAVASDGSINVSDYNQQYDGLYRNYWIAASTVSGRNLQFIHF